MDIILHQKKYVSDGNMEKEYQLKWNKFQGCNCIAQNILF